MPQTLFPRIEYLRIRNYRVLHDLELQHLTPLTVFIGPNGSGKTTVFDALAFLSECFRSGLNAAWKKRGGMQGIRSRGKSEPISFEIRYREPQNESLLAYYVSINETEERLFIEREHLEWMNSPSEVHRILEFSQGQGWVVAGEITSRRQPHIEQREYESFNTPDLFAANILGQFAKHPHLTILRQFLTNWLLADLTDLATQANIESKPQPRLSSDGSNLPNVVEYLEERNPQRLQEIINNLSRHIPQLQSIDTVSRQGKRRLQIHDFGLKSPISAHYASEGTLLMLAYLLILKDTDSHHIVLIDEPENNLHPGLMTELAEKFRSASAYNQVLITTHSPYFVNGLRPEELWVLYRGSDSFTQARRAADMRGVKEFVANGSLLGQLWMENYFDVSDPTAHP